MSHSQPARPVRVQRRRSKGWRMPPNTASVCRPGPFGNPFRLGAPLEDVDRALRTAAGLPAGGTLTAATAVQLYRHWLLHTPEGGAILQRAEKELPGKNLACYCSLEGPCHADVLLEVVNG